jgi:small-conductance mechanosensitive channel
MTQWFQQGEWLGNSVLAWVVAGLGALLGYAVAHGAASVLGARLRKLAARTHRSGFTIAAAVVEATRGWLLLLIAVAVALDFLHFGKTAEQTRSALHWLQQATFALVGLQIAFWISALVVAWLHRSTTENSAEPANPVMVGVLTRAAQFVVWVTLLLVLLANAGVNITAFVASLGVGGVAVALALQNVLSDLFASISIGLDKPFEVGEFIIFGSDMGTVTRVGIKSTRLQSLSGEELAISNSVLLKNLIHNYARMRERRVVFGFRLPYGTSRKTLEAVVERARAVISGQDKVRLDRGHFTAFGEYGFDFEFVYYVLDPGYNLYCDVQQRINLGIMAAMEELGAGFAIPARAVQSIGGAPDTNAGADKPRGT